LYYFIGKINNIPLPDGNLPKNFSHGAWHDLKMSEDINDLIDRVKESEERASIMVSLGIR
jgi:hypothetical protein